MKLQLSSIVLIQKEAALNEKNAASFLTWGWKY